MYNDSLTLLYKSRALPHLEYANDVWALRFKKDIMKLENVQRRATRMFPTLQDLEYCTKQKVLSLPHIAYRQYRRDMIEVYMYCHQMYKTGNQLLILATDNRTQGYSLKLQLQICTTRVRHVYFSNRVVNYCHGRLS